MLTSIKKEELAENDRRRVAREKERVQAIYRQPIQPTEIIDPVTTFIPVDERPAVIRARQEHAERAELLKQSVAARDFFIDERIDLFETTPEIKREVRRLIKEQKKEKYFAENSLQRDIRESKQ